MLDGVVTTVPRISMNVCQLHVRTVVNVSMRLMDTSVHVLQDMLVSKIESDSYRSLLWQCDVFSGIFFKLVIRVDI